MRISHKIFIFCAFATIGLLANVTPVVAQHSEINEACALEQICQDEGSSIIGIIYHDANRNAVYDDESLLEGWQISLYDEDWQLFHETLTDENGEFVISNVRYGAYYLCEKDNLSWLQSEPVTAHFAPNTSTSCYEIDGEFENEYRFGNILRADIEDDLNDGQVIGISDSATPKSPVNSGEVLGASVLAETGDSTILSLLSGLAIIISAISIIVLSIKQEF